MSTFDAMTPSELRREADRRELVERHRMLAERIAARDALAVQLVALDTGTVNAADARRLLRGVLDALATGNEADQEAMPTNGEISMVSHGGGLAFDWWHTAIADHPRRDGDSVLSRYRARRLRPWGGE